MYEYLTGKLISKSPVAVVLDSNGTGYFLQVPVSTYAVLPPIGEPFKLFTHFIVREDAQLLCGFATEEERELFRLFISVSGIGPRSALTALSAKSVRELKTALIQGSVPVLTSIPGIGKKTAERLIIELREKVVIEGGARPGTPAAKAADGSTLIEDSLNALMELGYRRQSAKQAIEKVMAASEEEWTLQDLIRASLKYV